MRAKTTWAIAVLTSAAVAIAAAGCTPTGKSGQAGAGLELVKSKCTMCHTIDRIDQANKDRPSWDQTIARMRSKGAQLSDTEAAQIAEYLTATDASK
jgi:cytochrome c2